MYEDVIERIKRQIVVDDKGCWIWQGRVDSSGYGDLRLKSTPSKTRIAHRISYEVFVARIPAGLQIDHLCRVRACVNPKHLEPVTPRENTLRSPIALASLAAQQATCKRGHAFDEKNTIWRREGGRACRTCKRDRLREFRERQRRVPADAA
ncbi:HNH endonuclease [Micromonospora sp. MED01]|uniref:HNH endonuclease signature motif containing protein n=1 Tax=Micromonospora alfalfae TaxID=2911212 RepID=UPI001EE8FB2F|nr:HNH endonuclease signature motif containing protein [Micromonospora alfalfae]MCG5460806.1 HNH endonuclease [Micromonospora alfalfae]